MVEEEQELPDNAARTAEDNNPPQRNQPEQDPLTHQQPEYGAMLRSSREFKLPPIECI